MGEIVSQYSKLQDFKLALSLRKMPWLILYGSRSFKWNVVTVVLNLNRSDLQFEIEGKRLFSLETVQI